MLHNQRKKLKEIKIKGHKRFITDWSNEIVLYQRGFRISAKKLSYIMWGKDSLWIYCERTGCYTVSSMLKKAWSQLYNHAPLIWE